MGQFEQLIQELKRLNQNLESLRIPGSDTIPLSREDKTSRLKSMLARLKNPNSGVDDAI